MIELDSIEKGFYRVIVDGVQVSQHSKALKANSRGLEEKYNNLDSVVTIEQPNIEIVVNVELTDTEVSLQAQIDKLTKEKEDMFQQILNLQSALGGGTAVVNPPVAEPLLAFPSAIGAGAEATGAGSGALPRGG